MRKILYAAAMTVLMASPALAENIGVSIIRFYRGVAVSVRLQILFLTENRIIVSFSQAEDSSSFCEQDPALSSNGSKRDGKSIMRDSFGVPHVSILAGKRDSTLRCFRA